MFRPSTRRRFLRGIALTGLTASTGCLSTIGSTDGSGGDGQSSEAPSSAASERESATPRSTPTTVGTASETPTNTRSTDASATPAYVPLDEWVAASSNFDGIVDRTDRSEVTVLVGAAGNGGAYAFDPPALLLRSNTTVVWEWTGDGGAHNVDFRALEVDSGDPTATADTTFTYTVETTGTHLYACEPHRALGMKGGFEVIE